jgi:hypothetical protein
MICWWQTRDDQDAYQLTTQKIKELSFFTLLYWVIFLINPSGLSALAHSWRVFLDPAYIQFYRLTNSIYELQSPGNIFTFFYIWFDAFLIANFILIILIPRKKFYFLLFYVFSIFFFLYAKRGIDFTIIVQLYIASEMAQSLSANKKWRQLKFHNSLNVALSFLFVFFFGFIILKELHLSVYRDHKTLNYFLTDIRSENPMDAIRFLKKNDLSGPMFNEDLFGGYLIWSSYPQIRPFSDGRQISMERFISYEKVLKEPQEYWNALSNRFKFSIVLLNLREQRHIDFARYLKQTGEWKIVYLDDGPIIFLNSRIVPNANFLSAQFEKNLNNIPLTQEKIVKLKIIPMPMDKNSLFSSFLQKEYVHIDLLRQAAVLHDFGYYPASARKIIEILEIFPPNRPLPELARTMAFVLLIEMKIQPR